MVSTLLSFCTPAPAPKLQIGTSVQDDKNSKVTTIEGGESGAHPIHV